MSSEFIWDDKKVKEFGDWFKQKSEVFASNPLFLVEEFKRLHTPQADSRDETQRRKDKIDKARKDYMLELDKINNEQDGRDDEDEIKKASHDYAFGKSVYSWYEKPKPDSRDWEIVKYEYKPLSKKDGEPFWIENNSCHWEDAKTNSDYKIYSVRRLTDNEVFTVGDEVGHKNGAIGGKIESFYINDKNELGLMCKTENSQSNYYLENWVKLPSTLLKDKTKSGLYKEFIRKQPESTQPKEETPKQYVNIPTKKFGDGKVPMQDYGERKWTPKEETKPLTDRVEVGNVYCYAGEGSRHLQITVKADYMPKEKLSLIKQAIEAVLNDELPDDFKEKIYGVDSVMSGWLAARWKNISGFHKKQST